MKKAVSMLAFAGVVLAAGTSYAGTKTSATVTVSTASRYAYGSMASARSSSDANQYIGCVTQGHAGGAILAVCSARNSAGVAASCSSTSSAVIQSVTNQTDHSWIRFEWDANGVCTFVTVNNSSQYAPLVP
jgi:hypothetical protein